MAYFCRPINTDEEWMIWAGQEVPEHSKRSRHERVKGSQTPASLMHFSLHIHSGKQTNPRVIVILRTHLFIFNPYMREYYGFFSLKRTMLRGSSLQCCQELSCLGSQFNTRRYRKTIRRDKHDQLMWEHSKDLQINKIAVKWSMCATSRKTRLSSN